MRTGNMRNVWNYMWQLGSGGENKGLSERTIMLCNQLNFLMLITMLFLFLAVGAIVLFTDYTMSLGTVRVINLLILNFLNLVIARFGFTKLSRLSVIFLPPVVFILGPTLVGYVEEESYYYYVYLVIATSIIPQLLINPREEKFLFWFSMTYYFLITVFLYRIMVFFAEDHFEIEKSIDSFYYFYLVANITLFLFINACIYYLRRLNSQYEEKMDSTNKELALQNIELKNQKNEIEKQKDELVTKEVSTWQKLVNIISHEIVNSAIPITNLAGMTGQMLEDESGAVLKPDKIEEEIIEDIHHGLKIIESRTQGLINFVKATKSLTQIPTPNIRQIILKELFDRISILYMAKFKESGIHFEKHINPPDLKLDADLELIEQVIINLIQNSLEAMQETKDRKLSINATKNLSGQVIVSIADNGKGMNNELLEKIFLPYYSTKPSNAGIGLSLAQQILSLHHARFEVETTPGNGAVFTIVF